MATFGNVVATIICIVCSVAIVIGFFGTFIWAIIDKIVECNQIRKGTYDPDKPLWFMKESKKSK